MELKTAFGVQNIDEITRMQDYLEITISENPHEIIERINDLNVYMARSGKMLADAKLILREARAKGIEDEIAKRINIQYLSATTQKALVESLAREENYLVDWLERINRTCTHQVDALRSLLSYEKEQLRLNQ